MAFPTVASVTATGITPNTTTHQFNLPATVNNGDLLILLAIFDALPALTMDTAGWTALGNQLSDSACRGRAWYKIAAGTEGGGTVQVTTGTTQESVGHVFRITSWHGTTPPEASAGATAGATSNSPNPDSLTPSWGAADTLWVAWWGNDTSATATAYPTNYTNGQTDASGGVAGDAAGIASSRRELNAASEDPGAGTISGSVRWIAETVAIRPAAAAVKHHRTLLGVGA